MIAMVTSPGLGEHLCPVLLVIRRPVRGNSRQSWSLDFTPLIPDSMELDSGFGIRDSLSMELVFRIAIISVILVSFSWIPESKAQYSGFHKQKFHRFRNMDSLTLTDILALLFSRSINQIFLAI